MNKTDIAVIGGGASGAAAAITAARLGASVTLIEAQPRIGRKLLATGNGRCNLSNVNAARRGYHSGCPEFVSALITERALQKTIDFFDSLGVACREESDGRLYPRSEQAGAVLDLIRAELDRLGVVQLCSCRVTSLRKSGGEFLINGDALALRARRVIAACGGKASPQLGGCDDGLKFLESCGHKCTGVSPALVPIKVRSEHIKSLKGLRVHCDVSLIADGKTLRRESGELQFGENALSGIAVFQLSSAAARIRPKKAHISVCLMPEHTVQSVRALLLKRRSMLGHLPLEQFFTGLVPKRIGVCLLKQAGVSPLNLPSSSLTDAQLSELASLCLDWRWQVEGVSGWQQAQVTSGGLVLSELSDTLESRRLPGLYACGELLDCDGDCGGYNLQFAWTTGMVAGEHAAKSL